MTDMYDKVGLPFHKLRPLELMVFNFFPHSITWAGASAGHYLLSEFRQSM